jgi:hypothetical protein
MAAALHGLAVSHRVPQVSVAVAPYRSVEAATFALEPDEDWERLHKFLTDVADPVPNVEVKLDVHQGQLLVVVVPLTPEAAAEAADEFERLV